MSWAVWADTVEVEPSLYASDFSTRGAAGGAGGCGRPRLPLRRRRRSLHPRDHDRPDRAGLDRTSRARMGCSARLPSHGERARASLRGGGEGRGDSVTFHVEACDTPARAIAHARSLGLAVGVALNPETAVEDAVAATDGADLVLCMSIHPGYSGRAFMPEAPVRIARVRVFLQTLGYRWTAGSTATRSSSRGRRCGSPRLGQRDLLERRSRGGLPPTR